MPVYAIAQGPTVNRAMHDDYVAKAIPHLGGARREDPRRHRGARRHRGSRSTIRASSCSSSRRARRSSAGTSRRSTRAILPLRLASVPGNSRRHRRRMRVLHALDHVIVAVRDLEAATATYERLLGRSPSWRGGTRRWARANTLFRLANTYLELLAPAGAGPGASQIEAQVSRATARAWRAWPSAPTTPRSVRPSCARAGSRRPTRSTGSGRDERTGAKREWRNVLLPTDATRGVWMFAIEHLSPPEALPPGALAVAGDARGRGARPRGRADDRPRGGAAPSTGRSSACASRSTSSFEARGVRLQFFRVGGVTVEVASRLAAPADPAPGPAVGLAWRVPDADRARARLADAGFAVERRPDRQQARHARVYGRGATPTACPRS